MLKEIRYLHPGRPFVLERRGNVSERNAVNRNGGYAYCPGGIHLFRNRFKSGGEIPFPGQFDPLERVDPVPLETAAHEYR